MNEDVVYVHNGMKLSHKEKKETLTVVTTWMDLCNNMDGPWGYSSKWNKSEKDNYCMVSLISGI